MESAHLATDTEAVIVLFHKEDGDKYINWSRGTYIFTYLSGAI